MATGTTEFIDGITADVFFPEMWSKHAIVAREARLNMLALVDTRYKEDLKYGDTIHVPNVTNLTAQTKHKSNNTALSYETVTETTVDITVGTWEYSGIGVESFVDVQSYKDQMALYAPKQAYALELAVDDVLAGLIDDFTANTLGTLAVPLEYADFLLAMQYLDDANVPDEDRVFVASPKQITYWMTKDEFIRSDYNAIHGGQGAPAGKHYVKDWLGIPIYRSTNVEGSNGAGHDNGMFHKEALACVMQMEPRTHRHYDIDYLCDKVVMEQLYGTKEMRDDHGVWCKGY